MFSTETQPRRSQECARGHGVVRAAAPGRATDGRGRSDQPSRISGSMSRGGPGDPMCPDQEGEREQRDHERPWDVHMAEAVTFLVSAHAILEKLSSESFRDPRAALLIASACGKAFEALSTLDDFDMTQLRKSAPTVGIDCSFAPLPTWWQCQTDFA
jgi:hypothetical protein